MACAWALASRAAGPGPVYREYIGNIYREYFPETPETPNTPISLHIISYMPFMKVLLRQKPSKHTYGTF